jgi:hypothetical protein
MQRQDLKVFIAAVVFLSVACACSLAPAKKNDEREEYGKKLEHFDILEEIASEAMNKRDTMSDETYLMNLKKTALVDWAECVNLFDEAKQLELPPALEENRKKMSSYADQRIQQTLLLIKAVEEKTDKYNRDIDSIDQQIRQLVEQIKENGDLDYRRDTSALLPLRES